MLLANCDSIQAKHADRPVNKSSCRPENGQGQTLFYFERILVLRRLLCLETKPVSGSRPQPKAGAVWFLKSAVDLANTSHVFQFPSQTGKRFPFLSSSHVFQKSTIQFFFESQVYRPHVQRHTLRLMETGFDPVEFLISRSVTMRQISVSQLTTCQWTFEEDLLRYQALGYDSIGIWRRKIDDFGHRDAIDMLYDSSLSVSLSLIHI